MALVTENNVVLGADAFLIGNPGVSQLRLEYCKIRPAGRWFVAASGRYFDTASRFDVWQTASKAAEGAQDLGDAVLRFEKFVLKELPQVVANAKTSTPESYKRWTAGEQFILSVVFVGMDHARPIAIGQDFAVHSSGGKIIARKPVKILGIADEVRTLQYGHVTTITAWRDNADNSWIQNAIEQPSEAVRNLILLEVIASRLTGAEDVGLPISLLKIDRLGPKWIESGACPPAR